MWNMLKSCFYPRLCGIGKPPLVPISSKIKCIYLKCSTELSKKKYNSVAVACRIDVFGSANLRIKYLLKNMFRQS